MNLLRVLAISVFATLVLFSRSSEASISCSDVISDLGPCVDYLENGSGTPPTDCCKGVKAVAAAATTAADRKAVCQCIKSVANTVTVKPELARNLTTNCGVSSTVLVSPDADCSTIG